MGSADSNDNAQRLVRSSEHDDGGKVLGLVLQVAEAFHKMEDHAREIEARAESMRSSTAEKLKHAEKLLEAAERARQETIAEADCKLQDAFRALQQAQASLVEAKDRLTAMEVWAQLAEAEAREAKQTLALVEEAIRKHLLSAHRDANSDPSSDDYNPDGNPARVRSDSISRPTLRRPWGCPKPTSWMSAGSTGLSPGVQTSEAS